MKVCIIQQHELFAYLATAGSSSFLAIFSPNLLSYPAPPLAPAPPSVVALSPLAPPAPSIPGRL